MRDSSRQKRKQARTNVNLPAEYVVGGDGRATQCTVTDIGTGGLAMLTKASSYVGDSVMVRVSLGKAPLSLTGVVVRVAGKSVGVQYTGLDEEQMAHIQEFIHTTVFTERGDSQ